MAQLYFKVSSDWEEVVRLRSECERLEKQLLKMDRVKAPAGVAALETQLAATKQQMHGMVGEAAKAGATLESDLKKGIYSASQGVNDLTQKIITQRRVIKDVEYDVRILSEQYKKLTPGTGKANGVLADLGSAKEALRNEKAALFDLTQQQAEARLSVKRLKDEYDQYKDSGKGVTDINDAIGVSLKKAFAVLGGATMVKSLLSGIVKTRGEFQLMDTSIQTLLGNKEKADALMKQVKEYATISPLELKDVSAATQMMLGFNIEAEKVPRFLRAIGDVSMGEARKFNSLTLAFSQMSSAGKLMGQDLNQMINAGFNPLSIMAEKTGKSIAVLKKEMSDGAISTEMVQQAFIDATSAGGKFYNMSENASKTINGQLSILSDTIDAVYNKIGTDGEGVIISAIKGTTSLVENYETIGKILLGLAATYGTYRAAIMATMALEKTHAFSRLASIKGVAALSLATDTLRIKTLALNKTMLANPYALAATLIIGAASAMWALRDSTTAAERAQASFNKYLDETKQKEEEHKRKIEEMIRAINDETTSRVQRLRVMDELKKSYPELFAKYIDEKGHISDLIGFWKEYNEVAGIRNIQNDKDRATQIRESISKLEEERKKGINNPMENPTAFNLRIGKNIEALRKELDLVNGEIKKQERLQWEANTPVEKRIEIHKREIESLKEKNREIEKQQNIDSLGGVSVPNVAVGLQLTANNRLIKQKEEEIKILEDGEKKKAVIYGSEYKAAKDGWTKTKAELDKIKANKDKYTKEQYEAAVEAEKAARESYQSLGGEIKVNTKVETNTNKLKSETADRLAAIREMHKTLQREEYARELETQQGIIDLMEDGSERVLMQIELDYEKRKAEVAKKGDELIKQQQDLERKVWEAANPNSEKKWDVSMAETQTINDLPAEQRQYLENQEALANEARIKSISDANKALLEKYQDYAAQRLAIEERFNNDIAALQEQKAAAEAKGLNTEAIERAMSQAVKNKGQELISFDFDLLKKSPEYVRAFEDLKNTSTETLSSLLEQLEGMKVKAAEVLDPVQLREYANTIQRVVEELGERGPFQALTDAQSKLTQSNKKLAIASRELSAARLTGDVDKITKAEINYRSALDDVTKANNDVTKAQKKVNEQMEELFNTISGLGDIIGGQAGKIVSLIGDIGNFVIKTVDGVKIAAQAGAAALSTIEKASAILAIIQMVIQLINKINEIMPDEHQQYLNFAAKQAEINKLRDAVNEYTAAVIEARQSEESWFGSNGLRGLRDEWELNGEYASAYFDKLHEQQAEYENEGVKGWARDWLKKAALPSTFISMGDIPSAIRSFQALDGTDEYIEKTTEAMKNLRIETREASKGFLGTGWGGKGQRSDDLVSWAKDNGFGDLFDEEGWINRDAAQAILKAHEDGALKLLGETEETLRKLDEYKEKYDEYKRQLREYVASLYEPLVDNFVDAVWDWFDNGKNALDSFKDYAAGTFRDIVSDMIRTIALDKIFDGFADDIVDLYDEHTQGNLTNEELMRAVNNRLSGVIEKAEDQLPVIQDMMNTISEGLKGSGIDIRQPGEASENTFKGAYAKASQESVDLLAGQTGGARVALEDIRRMMLERENGVTNPFYAEFQNSLNVVRDILMSGVRELVLIREISGRVEGLTAEIKDLNGRIASSNEAIAEGVSDTAAGIGTLVSSGVKVKGTGLGV